MQFTVLLFVLSWSDRSAYFEKNTLFMLIPFLTWFQLFFRLIIPIIIVFLDLLLSQSIDNPGAKNKLHTENWKQRVQQIMRNILTIDFKAQQNATFFAPFVKICRVREAVVVLAALLSVYNDAPHTVTESLSLPNMF